MPMRRPSRVIRVIDAGESASQTEAPALPPELEARIASLEAHAARADFDVSGWFLMILFGIAVPLVLLAIGWRA
jgi:hypothetical protein